MVLPTVGRGIHERSDDSSARRTYIKLFVACRIDDELKRRYELALLIGGKSVQASVNLVTITPGVPFGDDIVESDVCKQITEALQKEKSDHKGVHTLDEAIEQSALKITHLPVETKALPSLAALATQIDSTAYANTGSELIQLSTAYAKKEELLGQLHNAMCFNHPFVFHTSIRPI